MKAVVLSLLLAAPAAAQDYVGAEGASLRFLDKLTSETGDVTLSRGQAAKFGRLLVRLGDCRYPADNPASGNEAHLTIVEEATQLPLFDGWMLAAAPALSALDHPRYDVWLLSCILPEIAPAAPEGEGE